MHFRLLSCAIIPILNDFRMPTVDSCGILQKDDCHFNDFQFYSFPVASQTRTFSFPSLTFYSTKIYSD